VIFRSDLEGGPTEIYAVEVARAGQG
jgi:hypothetical protein